MALNGSRQLLKGIDVICTEINFEELYASCPMLADLDQFLERHQFRRIKMITPFHRSWGDAIYLRDSNLPSIN